MWRFLNYLLLCLTVVTVGVAQVAGTQVSYFCSGTGHKTLSEFGDCCCHKTPQQREVLGPHQVELESESGSHNENPVTPVVPQPLHEKVLEGLMASPNPLPWHAPEIVWFEALTDPFPLSAAQELSTRWMILRELDPPHESLLTEGVLIARTTVMLV